MTQYEAIKEMRRLTAAGIFFSFIYMSYSRERQQTQGIVEVHKAKLRKRGDKKYNQFAEIMEEYLDVNSNEPRHFYHPTLMFFNGQKITVK